MIQWLKGLSLAKLLIPILSIVTCTAVTITVYTVWFREPDVILTPDYAPEETEPNAEVIPGDDDTKLEMEDGGGAIGIEYIAGVTIDLSEKKASLQFANPGKSTQDMVLQIVIQDVIVAQSGRLEPGYQLKELALLKDAEKMLSEGGYDGKFVILSYDPESGEKAMVNTEAAITITVKK